MPTIHLLIQGKVQGVFYRATAREVASRLGLSGWVRNTPEGDVEAMATGTAQQLEQFVDWCRQGPPAARVTNVASSPREEEFFIGFEIRR